MSRKKESILILGLGGIGFYLARRVSREGYPITAIECNPALVARADAEIDARLIHGDALSFSSWREANAEQADYLIAVTDNDAVNITAALIADRCGVRRKIVRVRRLELWEPDAILGLKDLKIDLLIRPGELTAQEIARLLKMRSGHVVIDIDEEIRVVATRVTRESPLALRTLRDLSVTYDDFAWRIVALARDINTIIPGGNEKLLPGDRVFILTHRNHLTALISALGEERRGRHRVLVVGGGDIGRRIAELLDDSMPVRLIEANATRAEELTHLLPRTQVLHGDGSDTNTLMQAGLMDMDTLITATGDNETNIMTSVLAKHFIENKADARDVDAGRTIALVQREEYLVLASAMGTDVVLNRKVLAGNHILKYIRRGKLLSVAHLHGCDAEVIELVADAGSPVTAKPLCEFSSVMRGRMIIGGYHRDRRWSVAEGTTQLQEDDKVIAVCASQDLPDLQRLFDR